MPPHRIPLAASFLLVALLGAACTKSRAGTAVANSGGGATTADPDASGPRGLSHTETPSSGHRFSVRTHEPHYPAAAPPPPHPDALPRFVDGSARCFVRDTSLYSAPHVPTGPVPRHLGGSHSAPSSRPAIPRDSARDSVGPKSSAKADGYGAPPPSAPMAAEESRTSGAAAQGPKEKKAEAAPRYDDGIGLMQTDRVASSSGDREAQGLVPPARGGFGDTIYLSNDDTMSLSSAQRVIWAIDHYRPLPAAHIRPHELLNYFSFHTAPVEADHDFSIAMNIAPKEEDPTQIELALAVAGRPLTRATRRNANLAYVIDRSGSMAAEGRMEYLRQGLLRSLSELKNGDIVHVTLFDTTACDLAQNFVVGRDSMRTLQNMIRNISPSGSTNLHDGLVRGYASADRAYQASYTNRVILVTDALTNTGVTDERLISLIGQHYDARRIRLSGIGVGSDFNDSLLDHLTERGRGAYVFLGSPLEVDAVFGSRFVSLIETIADDVHFKLELPPSLALTTFYGEEASTQKERVQAIHYFAGTSQLFLSDLRSRDGRVPVEDDLKVTVEYHDPESGRARVEEFVWNIGQVAGRAPNLDKARLLSTFALRLKEAAELPLPPGYRQERYGYNDPTGYEFCARTADDLARRAEPLRADPEVVRVESLWNQYCHRYARVAVAPEPPRYVPPRPVPPPYVPPRPAPKPYDPPVVPEAPERNNDYPPPSSWPSARYP